MLKNILKIVLFIHTFVFVFPRLFELPIFILNHEHLKTKTKAQKTLYNIIILLK